jgi:hypothetical protein
MKTRFIAAALVVIAASIAVPALASGYGPAPFYRPDIGAPASQRGQSAQTLAAEHASASARDNNAYGGVADTTSQSGAKLDDRSVDPTYAHH